MTPVADARGIVRIIMLLPCRAAAPVRASVCQRLLDHLGASHDILQAALEGQTLASWQPVPHVTLSGIEETSSLEMMEEAVADPLAQLTDADVSRIRKTNESPPRVSVYDAIALLMRSTNPRRVWNDLQTTFPEVVRLAYNLKFPGPGQRETPVADARGIVRIIMLLPCRTAAPVRAKAADVLVRFLGGDPNLIQDIAHNRETQRILPSNHPARFFGETVEHEESRVPPAPLEFREAAHLEGGTHLYALGSKLHSRLFKTGSGKDPWERLRSEDRKHKGRLNLYLLSIWWNEGHLEHLARRHLDEHPPAELDIQGTEYRMTSQKEIKDATDAARRQYIALACARASDVRDEEEVAMKRRRIHLQLSWEELELDERRCSLTERKFALEKETFALEQERAYYLRQSMGSQHVD